MEAMAFFVRAAASPARAKAKSSTPTKAVLLLWGLHAETLLEAIDAAAAIHQLLLAGEERMTLRANFDPQLLFGGAGFERFAAHAAHDSLLILGMDLFLHAISPLLLLTDDGFIGGCL